MAVFVSDGTTSRICVRAINACTPGSAVVDAQNGRVFRPAGSIDPSPPAEAVAILGTYSPGNSAALIDGPLQRIPAETSILDIELGGLARGTGYDALNVGAIELGGTLSISLIDGFSTAGLRHSPALLAPCAGATV